MSVPAYSFLSRPPPPPQKKRPLIPLPATPRSSSFTAIATWAAHVQPGSPGSPNSPRRRSSLSRRPSVSGRRPSLSRTSPSSRSFLVIETPSPDSKDFSINLTDLGYTSVFLHLPKTPSTPSQFRAPAINPDTFPLPPPPPTPATKPLKRFRSLSILRSRNRSNTAATLPPSPTKSVRTPKSRSTKPKPKKPSSSTKFETPQVLAASIARRKKAVYAYAMPSTKHSTSQKPPKSSHKQDLPPSLAAEIALMQFADGGSTEANIKRLMEAHARANTPAGGADKNGGGVGDVYRDGKGGIWWDREEEMEYMHLLGGHGVDGEGENEKEKWVSFGKGEEKEGKEGGEEDDDDYRAVALASLAGVDSSTRRGSATSTVSFSSSFDPSNIIKLAEDDAMVVRGVPRSPPVFNVPFSNTEPSPHSPPTPILTIPSRPRSTNHYVHTSPRFFVFDASSAFDNVPPVTPRTPGGGVSAFRIPKTPLSPSAALVHPYRSGLQCHVRARSSPTRPSFSSSCGGQLHGYGQKRRQRGAARRRAPPPPPLRIVAHVPMRGVSPELGEEESSVDAKKEFVEDSFEPVVVGGVDASSGVDAEAPPPPPQLPRDLSEGQGDKQRSLKKKASKSLLGLFGRK